MVALQPQDFSPDRPGLRLEAGMLLHLANSEGEVFGR